MLQSINVDLLAQMANDQIEVNEVENILDTMYRQLPCENPDNRDYDRLFAANRLDKANDAEIKKFKKAEIDQKVREIARKVDLSDEQLQKAVSQLSGGQ